MLLDGRLTLWTAAPMHLAVIAILSLWLYFSEECRQDLRLPLLLVLMTLVMGPIGAAGSLVTLVFAGIYARRATPFEEWYASLFPESQVRSGIDLWQRIVVDGEENEQSSVAPFTDILFFGNLAQKQELIAVVSKNFQPVFAPVLRMALNDSNNAIRVQAASAIAKIEDEFLERSLALSESARQNPGDPSLLWKLGRLNDDYANAGILDRERARESRKRANEAYEEYLKRRPDHIEARVSVARLLLKDEKFLEAAHCLEDVIRRTDTPVPAVLLYMESLFSLGRLDDLRSLARNKYPELVSRADTSVETLDNMKLWAGAVSLNE
jgi:tetratricopeptide (TPR) repeat protein